MNILQRLVLFIALSAFVLPAGAQPPVKNYEKEWKVFDGFVKKELPKSALAQAKKIYELAKKDNQDAQLVKSIIYIVMMQDETREENELLSVGDIEKEIAVSKEPVTSILYSLLAEVYKGYYEGHRWQFYNRTATVNFKKDDPATWTAEDFHKKISELYLRSIREEKMLQQIRLESFNAIIVKGNVRHLRPTLFDLLAHRALTYFQNDERDVSKPAYRFEIDQASAFAPAAEFVRQSFPSNDSQSLRHKALLLFQRLLAFHLKDPKPDALLDVDILRLGFVKGNSVHPQKDELYMDALDKLTKQYGSLSAASQAWYLMAKYYDEKAATYKAYGDSTHRLDRIKALQICQQVITQKDSSEGKYNCINLLNSLKQKSLEFSLEKVNQPGQSFRALVYYRNISQLYLRLIKADENLKKQLENSYDPKYWTTINSAPSVKSWQQTLPATTDMQRHQVEIKVDGLPVGEYLLVAANSSDADNAKTLLGARMFYVSAISFVSNHDDYFVMNRDNGQPLAGASVQTWEQKYDYAASKYKKEKARLYKTDANGHFHIERIKDNNNRYVNTSYFLDITYQTDHLYMDDLIYDYYYYNNNDNPTITTSIYLFLDRSIYRPGQTVFFKGIVMMQNAGEKTAVVRKEYETVVILKDANSKEVDTIRVKTNDYGSFSGKFQLPETGLNGAFRIVTRNDNGSVGFRVEDYKRPKFYVEYEPIKGTYKVNDKISITGNAKAYAGNTIDAAMVKYRVVRKPRFIYMWYFSRWWQPPTEELEIAHGEMKTDKDGKFIISFTAIPDLKTDKKYDPVFDYTIYADVTDLNGETRSQQTSVTVGYKALLIRMNIPASLPADSLKSLAIETENMSGVFEPANIKVTITRLKEEQRLIRSRYWERPDQFVMTKDEYIRNFPYDEYDNETDLKTWEKTRQVFDKTDSSRSNGKWPLNAGRFEPGTYMIEVSTLDKYGELVKNVDYIDLYDEASTKLTRAAYTWRGSNQNVVEPGSTAKIEWGSTGDNLFVIQEVDRNITGKSATPEFSYLHFNNEKKVMSFPVSEADRGGFGVNWLYVKHNRFYTLGETIYVPWTNKDLAIEYATYRDKTLPGSEEKWKLRITGYKNEKVAAEMLASMYDASLDQFSPHGWYKPSIWPGHYSNRAWNGNLNFSRFESIERFVSSFDYKYIRKIYDFLFMWEGSEDIISIRGNGRSGAISYKKEGAPVMADGQVNLMASKVAFQRDSDKDGGENKEAFDVSQPPPPPKKENPPAETQVRKNFNETAFFFPDLRTDSTGAIEFSFTIPESLTRWKFTALAHTKDLAFGYSTKEIVTQKQLMVQPNAPRFLREGDRMEFSSKVVNLTDKELKGRAQLQLLDATSNQPVDASFSNTNPFMDFAVKAGQSELVKFPIAVPLNFNKALIWRIVAKAGDFSDGEEMAMPVLTNRMLVTETMTLPVRGNDTKNFTFTKLLNSASSKTLQTYALTLEYTSNPAWYAVQALPYLMEYPYECAEQTWNRYYANSLASFVSKSTPRIQQVFERWKIKDSAALLSNLQKNQELKSVLLEETPWVLQAKNENEQKKNIALLFDMIRMSKELNNAYEKFKQMQSSNGGFVWFKGGPDDRYMTQYIVTGIGHLKKLNAIANGQTSKLNDILDDAIPYLDRKIKEDYDYLVKYKVNLKTYSPDYSTIQYLYMRSFFPEKEIAKASLTAYNYFKERASLTWMGQSKYMQGMIALALSRKGDTKTPAAILRSLKETSITNEELGMYWKDLSGGGWFWHQAPIETQALLIETFQEIAKDTKTVDDLRTWLLKNKQTNNWKTTKATAEACYALLIQGTAWLNNDPVVEVKLGTTTISSTDNAQEAGTGYFKKTITGENVNPQMGNISVKVTQPGNTNTGVSWGGIYWQYFEDLDKITTASTPLKLVKKLFVEKNTDRGPVITPVNEGDVIKVGDKIKVRVELRVDRDMEYVHMKDMRASALEPVNVLSGYKWQDGLGYYESTRDASTNFFFNYLRKGTYVFEYVLFVTHSGNFSNGITTIQCMYAPEFTSHSEGIRISVKSE